MAELKDIEGQVFGYWKVISKAKPRKNQYGLWNCRCVCGNERIVRGADLRSGKSTNCGCVKRAHLKVIKTKHGLDGSRINGIWYGIKARCYNKNYHKYQLYGKRGIIMCDEWRDSFEAFAKWAYSNGYTDSLSIDRIDNNGPYSPENCRWVDNKQQANNTRRNLYVTYDGTTRTVAQWADFLGTPYEKLRREIHKYGPSIIAKYLS